MDIPETLHTARVFLSLSESHTWNPLGEKINKYLDSVTKFRVCGRKGSFFVCGKISDLNRAVWNFVDNPERW